MVNDGGKGVTYNDRDVFFLPENLGPRLMGLSSSVGDDSSSLAYLSPALAISSDPSAVAHGRGLIATSDISAGELLLVHPPTVRADVSQVLRIYQNKASKSSSSSCGSNLLESIAETVLLKEMKRAIRGRTKQARNAKIAASFLALNGEHSSNNNSDNHYNDDDETTRNERHMRLARVLLGIGTPEDTEEILSQQSLLDDNEHLLGIIRHNAFGPDFHHYHRMERELFDANHADTTTTGGNNTTSIASLYSRVLGHYPLAAMINHSCGPTNAARVFYGETMVASATMDIPRGTELVWPYCPPILPFPERHSRLERGYGFSCSCQRCLLEGAALEGGIPPPLPLMGATGHGGAEARLGPDEWSSVLESVEAWYRAVTAGEPPKHSNNNSEPRSPLNLGECLRLGHTQLYIDYFNQSLAEKGAVEVLLDQATELHRSFARVHNACTEHLSLLHLSYELEAIGGSTSKETGNGVRIWTERLKQAHLCRYSSEIVGKDLETLRTVLRHTRTVLRTRNGWKASRIQGAANSFL